jgi:uncharacterized protein YegP (UPF0339 family)
VSTVTIHIRKSRTRWPHRRPQRWYWTAVDGGNHKTLARSSEMYTNEDDAYRAAELLHGNTVDVLLVRPGKASRVLRRPL